MWSILSYGKGGTREQDYERICKQFHFRVLIVGGKPKLLVS
ncbi:MAG: hypothetical protein VXZ82_12700 [Planctomycetota bacterium]|nr:hypothetical protein [Planctomycetota bacterium]